MYQLILKDIETFWNSEEEYVKEGEFIKEICFFILHQEWVKHL